jgi:hypothetical protein
MKEIICYSKKYGKQTALVDDEMFETINKHTWNLYQSEVKNSESTDSGDENKKYKYYAQTNVKKGKKTYTIRMHQMIFGPVEKGFVIDHINGNSLDNTLSNLRQATRQVNAQNRKPKNKYLGVSWIIRDKKYRSASMGHYIGSFDDEKIAAEAYDKYIIQTLGADSGLNFKYTLDEIRAIKNEVVEVKKERELPSNICLTSNNTYKVQFRSDIYKACKTFKTLDKAIVFKDQCLEAIKKIETEKLQHHYKKPVTINKDGTAYITVKYKNKEFECLVDADKWHNLSLIGWYLADKYVYGWINGKMESLHRYLYQHYFPDIDMTDKLIDHIDGKDELSKRLDNRMSNLRLVTHGGNAYNKETKNKLGYRGVSKYRNKFNAYIRHDNQTYRTKGFSTVEEAALAYNDLAAKYYGDMAKLNVMNL